jgi:hypothetical protein
MSVHFILILSIILTIVSVILWLVTAIKTRKMRIVDSNLKKLLLFTFIFIISLSTLISVCICNNKATIADTQVETFVVSATTNESVCFNDRTLYVKERNVNVVESTEEYNNVVVREFITYNIPWIFKLSRTEFKYTVYVDKTTYDSYFAK